MESVLLVLATLCYFIGMIGYLVYLLKNEDMIHRIAWGTLLAGAILHGIAIGLESFERGELAVASSHEALSFFAWVIVVVYLVVQPKFGLRVLGAFVSPLAVIFMLVSSLLPQYALPENTTIRSGWVIFHVALLFAANALFALAFSSSLMYLLQERQIKKKHFGFLYPRLPSLERLDQINHRCLLIGFPLMTIGLVTGFAYAGKTWRASWEWDPKIIFALATWFMYAVLLHERLTVGWRGRRAAWLAILGFMAILVTFLGVNLLFKSHHTAFFR